MKSLFRFSRASVEDQRYQELKALCLFQDLTPREMRELEELLHQRSYQKEEIIFDEGDTGLGLYIVLSGRVKVVSSFAALQKLGPEFGPGEFFGELALFDEAPRTARAVALEPAEVVALFRHEFLVLLDRDRGIAAKILYEFSRIVCRRSRKLVVGEKHSPII